MRFMKKWYENNQAFIWAVTVLAASIIWIYATFPTMSALADKEASLKAYVDEKHNSVERELNGMASKIDKIDDRTVEILKEIKR